MVEETPYSRILPDAVEIEVGRAGEPVECHRVCNRQRDDAGLGRDAVPAIRCLTVSRISSAAAEMVIGAVSQRRAIHLGALDPLPDLVETRRGCKAIATAAASSKCVRSSGSGWRLTV